MLLVPGLQGLDKIRQLLVKPTVTFIQNHVWGTSCLLNQTEADNKQVACFNKIVLVAPAIPPLNLYYVLFHHIQ